MNWKRKGFLKLMTQVSKGEIGEIVVGHKDRLCPAILSFRHSKAFRDLKNISKGVLGAILHVLLCLKAGRLVK
jgi:predicted site-specific integrase-resolvase